MGTQAAHKAGMARRIRLPAGDVWSFAPQFGPFQVDRPVFCRYAKHLPAYLEEMTFQFNCRNSKTIFLDTSSI